MTKPKTPKPPRDPYVSCPKCGETTYKRCADRRKQIAVCAGHSDDSGEPCAWESEPYTPRRRPVRTSRTQEVDVSAGGWSYEAFDQHGVVFVSSEVFRSRKACEAAALKEIESASKHAGYGKCCAVIWPPTVKVKGTLIRAKRAKQARSA